MQDAMQSEIHGIRDSVNSKMDIALKVVADAVIVADSRLESMQGDVKGISKLADNRLASIEQTADNRLALIQSDLNEQLAASRRDLLVRADLTLQPIHRAMAVIENSGITENMIECMDEETGLGNPNCLANRWMTMSVAGEKGMRALADTSDLLRQYAPVFIKNTSDTSENFSKVTKDFSDFTHDFVHPPLWKQIVNGAKTAVFAVAQFLF